MSAREVVVPAADGFPLKGSLVEPAGGASFVVLLNPAFGVRRRYYRAFAEFLAGRGAAVLTYDYRGVGDSRPRSLRGFAASMAQWGELDAEGALRWLAQVFPDARPRVVAHSAGGQLLGMAPSASRVVRALFVATQSGWKGHWDGIWYWRVAAIWHLMIPVATRLWGYLPGFLGVGEDVPAGVAREWARWGRHPDYLMRDGGAARRAAYAALRFPIRSLAIADDNYAPERAAAALLELYSGAPRELRVVHPADLGRATLGHFGPFRATEGAALWPALADWVLAPESSGLG